MLKFLFGLKFNDPIKSELLLLIVELIGSFSSFLSLKTDARPAVRILLSFLSVNLYSPPKVRD